MKYPTLKPGDVPRDELILSYLPLIKLLARKRCRIGSNILDVEDLISAGVIGLCKAIEGWDPDYHVLFMTYAQYRIKGEMIDELRSLDVVTSDYRRKLNKNPDNLQHYVTVPLENLQFAEKSPVDPVDLIFRKDMQKILRKYLAKLPKMHRTVLRMYFFRELWLFEIGKKLGFSESRASQIKNEGLRDLAEMLANYRLDSQVVD